MRTSLTLSLLTLPAALPAATVLPVSEAPFTALGPSTESFGVYARPLATGDLNGDGFDDLITSTSQFGDGYEDRAVIFAGSDTIFSPPQVVSLITASPDLTVFSPVSEDHLATAFAVGDYNGDGTDDLAMAAPFASALGRPESGIVYTVFGRENLFDSPELLLSGFGASNVTVVGSRQAEGLGTGGSAFFPGGDAVSLAAGDLNGDPYDDLVIGAILAGDTGPFGAPEGIAYVLFGRAYSPSGTTLRDMATVGSGGANLRIFGGDDDEMGSMIAVGDVSGDGLDDIALGIPFYAPTTLGLSAGQVAIVRGRETGWPSAIDIVADRPDVSILSTVNGTDVGDTVTLGDFDGDGVQDVAVGSPGTDVGVRIYWGGERFAPGGAARIVIQTAPGDVLISGGSAGSFPGWSADLNRDGFDDLLIARRDVNFDGITQAGATSVLLGRPRAAWPAAIDLDAGEFDAEVRGTEFRDTAGEWAHAGDMDGDGYPEIVVGGPFGRDEQGAVWVLPLPISPEGFTLH